MKWCLQVLALCGLAVSAMTLPSAVGEDKVGNEKRQLLAVHETLAVLDGVEYRLCRGLTTLCPDKCGHSGEFASFTIKKYLKYRKLGEYGDPEQETFLVQVSDYDRKPKGEPKILATVKGLAKGDFVLLSWHHDYVTNEKGAYPERPIVKLEKIDKDKAGMLLKDGAKTEVPDAGSSKGDPAEKEPKPDPKVAPIKELPKLAPKDSVFKGPRPGQPLVIRSEKEASEYFPEEELAKLKKQVNFAQQIVLLFAWSGSGQDNLTFAVAESYPEQVSFTYQAGRTRDLRMHARVYALRSNVRWSVE
jgi:hypothetical protein